MMVWYFIKYQFEILSGSWNGQKHVAKAQFSRCGMDVNTFFPKCVTALAGWNHDLIVFIFAFRILKTFVVLSISICLSILMIKYA